MPGWLYFAIGLVAGGLMLAALVCLPVSTRRSRRLLTVAAAGYTPPGPDRPADEYSREYGGSRP